MQVEMWLWQFREHDPEAKVRLSWYMTVDNIKRLFVDQDLVEAIPGSMVLWEEGPPSHVIYERPFTFPPKG